ncbi:hypothetical protein DFR58_11111 [Anaerobacterium chartisolvens]|uniref:Uncharacterized protein n=1 Tax=Anaerobacterium chartisolvens TaxID=1297424 RepID=A0A369B6N2_9FIRM|nr:hypothetical protein DFR58_11111 [Anaerobacterium chartisolvens]
MSGRFLTKNGMLTLNSKVFMRFPAASQQKPAAFLIRYAERHRSEKYSDS